MIPILADPIPSWPSTVAVLSMCVTALGLLISGGVLYYMKRQSDSFAAQTVLMREQLQRAPTTVIQPQPLEVEVVKELDDRFASKQEFKDHVKNNSERHLQLFNKIELAETTARNDLSAAMTKVDGNLVFIRENLSAINRELKIRHEP